MKIIGFEEHYVLPALFQALPNNMFKTAFDVLKDTGRFGDADPQSGLLAGVGDLGEGRIAAMDAAGIDVQSCLMPRAQRPWSRRWPSNWPGKPTTQSPGRSQSTLIGSSASPPCR